MVTPGPARAIGWWALALLWAGMLGALCGCSEAADRLDARALRRQFPEQAAAILEAERAFAWAGDGFEAARPLGAEAGEDGEDGEDGAGALSPRFPREGAGAVRFTLADGAEVAVQELDAAGEGEIADNAVAYTRRGGTSFWTALSDDGYEEWLLLEASAVVRDAPVAVWQVQGAALRQQGEAVELADARGAAQLRVTAPEAYAAGGRPVGTWLVARGERLELWVEAEGEAVLVDPQWKPVRNMNIARHLHAAARLPDGRVLVTGGLTARATSQKVIVDSVEVFDLDSGTWSPASPMSAARFGHSATALTDGRVLVAGGEGPRGVLASAEVFDPVSGEWAPVDTLEEIRSTHSATLLKDGRVLIAGGQDQDGTPLGTAEVFDPASGKWTGVGDMNAARLWHTATLLKDGRVLVAGGDSTEGTVASAEVFDPELGAWSVVDSMDDVRYGHGATLLNDGWVLVAGGYNVDQGALPGAEVFDPSSGRWHPVGPLRDARFGNSVTLLEDGRAIAVGGYETTLGKTSFGTLASAEAFDPEFRVWLPLAPMQRAHSEHIATPLEGGQVLVTGGQGHGVIASAEVFDPTSSTWTSRERLSVARTRHTATRLEDKRVLVAGGSNEDMASSGGVVGITEAFDPVSGAWQQLGEMRVARADHTATLLQDGRVLVAGGTEDGFSSRGQIASAEVFEPGADAWRLVGEMREVRALHTATRMNDGRVLVAGGFHVEGREGGKVIAGVEAFDPATDAWQHVAPMAAARYYHTATLLEDGWVLVAGGYNAEEGATASVEVFDPATGAWRSLEPMLTARYRHAATLLQDGRVLVAGGFNAGGIVDTAEVLEPDSGRWVPVGSLRAGRNEHSMTLLPDGTVLVVGGADFAGRTLQPYSVEAFDPSSSAWATVDSMLNARFTHTATLLDDGGVLVVGGGTTTGDMRDDLELNRVEVFRKLPQGRGCATAIECQSGSCTDGVCCDQRCDVYLCEACSAARGASADGVCTLLHPDYEPYACAPRTGEPTDPCKTVRDCADGYVCDGEGHCVPPPPSSGYVDKGGCHLATSAGRTSRGPVELGLLIVAALSAALRRRRDGQRGRAS
ncbi:kelch repeat-containing protein [Sorangium sp. So ce131]|uniref:kelch repeat-containing protein n=1 Tax=Sorangium sp. So ce131 TaxID=3133282 RepID=UPI003F62C2A2